MLAAFLTTILFSISGVTAARSTRLLAGMEANFWRLLWASILLALYAEIWGQGWGGAGQGWFLVSGVVGFGVGDLALYLAYPRLGSRLVILIVHCIAAPLAAAVEWIWMGTPLTGGEMLAGGLILTGVGMALYPGPGGSSWGRAGFAAGVGFALIAAGGQGLGAVLSRQAFDAVRQAGEHVDGLTAAYQRILPGLALSALTFVWVKRRGLRAWWVGTKAGDEGGRFRQALPWVLVNGLAGPALGVGCFQWALAERGTGVVLPIVALTPLVIIPLSIWLEGERPGKRSLAGGVVAVAGAVLHAWLH